MLDDPENNPQPGGEFDHPAIEPLDLFAHADPMPPVPNAPEEQQQPMPIPPLLPPETSAPDPKPLDPPLQSSIPATEPRETPHEMPLPPDPFDQKTGGANFDLLGQVRKLQEEVAILRKQLMDVWPPRGTAGAGGTISCTFTAQTSNGYNTSTHVLSYTTSLFTLTIDLDAGTATVTPVANSPTTIDTAVIGTCT